MLKNKILNLYMQYINKQMPLTPTGNGFVSVGGGCTGSGNCGKSKKPFCSTYTIGDSIVDAKSSNPTRPIPVPRYML